MGLSSAGEIVTTPAQLARLVAHARQSGRFALDTEFVSEETFEPILCLVQLATREHRPLRFHRAHDASQRAVCEL